MERFHRPHERSRVTAKGTTAPSLFETDRATKMEPERRTVCQFMHTFTYRFHIRSHTESLRGPGAHRR